MRFTRLQSQFNIIKRFCHHNNIAEQTPKNINIVSKLNDIDTNLNIINTKLDDINSKLKNMDAIIFINVVLWNGFVIPAILYLI